MSARSDITVHRWTDLSVTVAIVTAVVAVLLVIAPAFLSVNVIDRLTTLLIYVILAVMWNALAGYGGLVSIGQQAFFGLGAYFAIRLSEWGLSVFPSLIVAAVLVGLVALPISVFM